MPVSYRKARPGDAGAVRLLLGELGYEGLPESPFAEAFARAVAHPEFNVWVAADRVALVGVIVMSHRPQLHLAGPVASIDELVVAGAYRSQGIGTQLVKMATERARDLRCVRIELQTRRSRDSYMRGFYTGRGFVEMDSALLRLALRP